MLCSVVRGERLDAARNSSAADSMQPYVSRGDWSAAREELNERIGKCGSTTLVLDRGGSVFRCWCRRVELPHAWGNWGRVPET